MVHYEIDLINTTCSELALILQAESNLHADFPRPDLDLQKHSFTFQIGL